MTVSLTLVPWAVALVGALAYGFAPGKLAELGRLTFAVAVLAALFRH